MLKKDEIGDERNEEVQRNSVHRAEYIIDRL